MQDSFGACLVSMAFTFFQFSLLLSLATADPDLSVPLISPLRGIITPPQQLAEDKNGLEWIDTFDGPQLIRVSTSITSQTSPSQTTNAPLSPLISSMTITSTSNYTHNNESFAMSQLDFGKVQDIDEHISINQQKIKKLIDQKLRIMDGYCQQLLLETTEL